MEKRRPREGITLRPQPARLYCDRISASASRRNALRFSALRLLLPDPPTLPGRPHCSPMRSTKGTSTTRSCCSHLSGHGMQGRPLQRSPSDGLQLVLCI
jgi:hypothetical protein